MRMPSLSDRNIDYVALFLAGAALIIGSLLLLEITLHDFTVLYEP